MCGEPEKNFGAARWLLWGFAANGQMLSCQILKRFMLLTSDQVMPMSRIDFSSYEDLLVEENGEAAVRRDAKGTRRDADPRRRSRKKSTATANCGGIRQRRNKHWNW